MANDKKKPPSKPPQPKTARQDEPPTAATMARMDAAYAAEDQSKVPTLTELEPVVDEVPSRIQLPGEVDTMEVTIGFAEPETKLEKPSKDPRIASPEKAEPPVFKEVIKDHRFIGFATQFMTDGLKFENLILQAGAVFKNTDRENVNDRELPPGKYNVWCLDQVIYAEKAE